MPGERGVPTRARSISQFATATMCNSFERGRHVVYVSTSRRILRTRAAYAPSRPSTKPFQGDYARVCVKDCDTDTNDGGGGGVRGSWRERGGERTPKPAGRSARQLEEERRCCALPVLYDRVLRAIDQPAGEIDRPCCFQTRIRARGSARREKGEASGVMSPSYLTFRSFDKKIASSRAGINRFLYVAAILDAVRKRIAGYGGSNRSGIGLEWMNFRLRHKLMSASESFQR